MHNVGATQWRDRDKYTHETSAPNFHLNLACLCQFDDDHDHDHSVIYQPCPKSCQAGVYMITPISRLISDKAERLNPSTALKQVRAWAMPDSTLSLITKACDQRFFFSLVRTCLILCYATTEHALWSPDEKTVISYTSSSLRRTVSMWSPDRFGCSSTNQDSYPSLGPTTSFSTCLLVSR